MRLRTRRRGRGLNRAEAYRSLGAALSRRPGLLLESFSHPRVEYQAPPFVIDIEQLRGHQEAHRVTLAAAAVDFKLHVNHQRLPDWR